MDMIFSLLKDFPQGMSLGRMAESIVLLFLIWSKLKPHLKKVEEKLDALEKAVSMGFNSGEQRFQKIEKDIEILKQQQPNKGIDHEKFGFV